MQNKNVFVRNGNRAFELRKQAAANSPMLGTNITTAQSFVKELWDLYGDERDLISGDIRTLLMLKALHDAEDSDSPLKATIGTARLLGSFVSRHSGSKEFETYLECDTSFANLPIGLASTLHVIKEYVHLCKAGGLIEPGSAAAILKERNLSFDVSAHEDLFLQPAVQDLIRSFTVSCENSEFSGSKLAPEGAKTRFLFLTGSTVLISGIRQEIQHALDSGAKHIAVLAKGPLQAYDALSPYLAESGIAANCRSRIPFTHTNLGRSLLSVYALKLASTDWKCAATDFAYSPLSGMSLLDAQWLNTEMRRDSLMEPRDVINKLAGASPTFNSFIGFLNDPTQKSVDRLEEAIQEITGAKDHQTQAAILNESALSALKDLVLAANALDLDLFLMDMLEKASVSVSIALPLEGRAPSVSFMPTEDTDSLAPGSFDAVIFADTTKDTFPIPRAKPATDAILGLMGIKDETDKRDKLRAGFATALRAATSSITLITPMRALDGSQKYPSFLYDELVQAIAGNDVFYADAEELFAVPASLKGSSDYAQMDEMDIVQGLGQTFTDISEAISVSAPNRGSLNALNAPDKMWMDESDGRLRPVLSASQLQNYWDCPYKWFVSNLVRVNEIDETMGSIQIGNLAHKVLKGVFEHLKSKGHGRITPENLSEAQTVAAERMQHQLDLDSDRSRSSCMNRCVPTTQRDLYLLERLKKDLMSMLEFMSQLPADLEATYFELSIPREANDGGRAWRPEYAGALMNGAIDRADIGPDGRYAIYDYKGSLYDYNAGHSKKEPDSLPKKIQALVYAQVFKRLIMQDDMTCEAAMYLSYKATDPADFMAGSLDPTLFPVPKDFKTGKSSVDGSFDDFLDEVEGQLAACVEGMLESDIEQLPNGNVCKFCPMQFCDMRQEA